jgi:hypothetical protein
MPARSQKPRDSESSILELRYSYSLVGSQVTAAQSAARLAGLTPSSGSECPFRNDPPRLRRRVRPYQWKPKRRLACKLSDHTARLRGATKPRPTESSAAMGAATM